MFKNYYKHIIKTEINISICILKKKLLSLKKGVVNPALSDKKIAK